MAGRLGAVKSEHIAIPARDRSGSNAGRKLTDIHLLLFLSFPSIAKVYTHKVIINHNNVSDRASAVKTCHQNLIGPHTVLNHVGI